MQNAFFVNEIKIHKTYFRSILPANFTPQLTLLYIENATNKNDSHSVHFMYHISVFVLY